MKTGISRFREALLFAFILLSVSSIMSQDCRPLSGEVYYLKVEKLNLRESPHKDAKVLSVLDWRDHHLVVFHGDSISNNYILVTAIKDSTNFDTYEKIVLESKFGWVSLDFILIVGDNYSFNRQFRDVENDIVSELIHEELNLKSSLSCKYNPTRLAYGYCQLGIYLFKLKSYFEAIKQFKLCIDVATKNSFEHKTLAIYYKALCKMNLGDNFGAVEDFKLVKNESRKTVGSTMVIGWEFETLNSKFRLPSNTPAVDMESVLLNLAICNARLANYREALADINTVLIKNKNSGNAYYIRAQIYLAQNKKESSCIEASKAGELDVKEAYDFIAENCN